MTLRHDSYDPGMSFPPVHRTSSEPLTHRWVVLLPVVVALLLGGLPGLTSSAVAAPATGTLSGKVTWHEPDPSRKIEVWHLASSGLWAPAPGLTTYAAGNGTYSVTVPAGEPVTLRVSYHDADHGYFYGDHYTAGNAEAVQVAAGRTRTGIDLDVPAPAYLSGRVTNAFGAPITAHVSPGVNDAGGIAPLQPAPTVSTRAGGYRVVVPAGAPVANLGSGLDSAEAFGSAWLTGGRSEPNRYLELAAGETRRVEDIVLSGGVAAVGTVRDRNGLPVVGTHVAARQGSSLFSTARTDAQGHYRLSGLGRHQGDFVLEFSGEGLLTQWWRGAESPGDARPVSPGLLPVNPATSSVGPFDAVMDYDPGYRLTATRSPVVRGSSVAGAVLRAEAASWSTGPSGVRRQWLRNGVAIRGATGPAYRLTSADVGRRISVRTTALRTLDGVLRPAGSSVSRATSVVKARSVLSTSVRGRHGRVVVTLRLRTAGAARPAGLVRVRSGARAGRSSRVVGAVTTRTVSVPARRGWRTVRVSYSGSAYATAVARTVRVRVH